MWGYGRQGMILIFLVLTLFHLAGCGSDQTGDPSAAKKKPLDKKNVQVAAGSPAIDSRTAVTIVNPVPEMATAHHKTPFPLSGESYSVRGSKYYILASAAGFHEEGQASWYGRRFHGRKTASGERYDMHAMTAAHKVLPFGTKVKVTNLLNGLDTIVRINDRGPFYPPGRIIDLSLASAEKLRMVELGHVPVRIQVWRSQGVNRSTGMALSRKDGFSVDRVKMTLRHQRTKLRYKQALDRRVSMKKEKP